jgi:hypothetical protein
MHPLKKWSCQVQTLMMVKIKKSQSDTSREHLEPMDGVQFLEECLEDETNSSF